MATRMFALINGLIYTVAGIVACLPQFLWRPDGLQLRMADLRLHGGYIAGVVEVNLPHNVIWIAIGIGGILASASFLTSKAYAQGVCVAAILMVFMGLMPLGIGDLFGFLPLSGFNIMIHLVTALLAWYYGFVYPIDVRLRRVVG